jgi:hypothetical protein
MVNKLFIAMTPDGYSLSISMGNIKEATQYNKILRRGNFSDLIISLKDVPEEVYKEGVQIDFGSESIPVKISESGKDIIRGLVAVFEKEAFHNFLDNLIV